MDIILICAALGGIAIGVWLLKRPAPRTPRTLRQRRIVLRNLNEMGDLRYHWR
jgi:hypothetical protein